MNSSLATILTGHRSPLSSASTSPLGARFHSVQFYRDDAYLIEQLGNFVAPAINAGAGILLVTTRGHRDSLFARLRSYGTDFVLAVTSQRFVLLDAEETLEKFMVKGQPDAARFEAVIGARLNRLALASEGSAPQLFVFGEMVATLWMQGRREAALTLEKLWNRLVEKYSFQLLCAYPMRLFSQQHDLESLLKICAEHTHVLPAERPSRTPGRPDRLHNLLLLQQKACALETEITEQRRLQNALVEREAELLDCLESAALGMHWITPGGTIVWANKAQLELLGYTREQYTGHHISQFHAVPFECANMLQRINRREELRAYPATLQCNNGTLRRVHIDSNPFFRKGQVAYTRCFITAAA